MSDTSISNIYFSRFYIGIIIHYLIVLQVNLWYHFFSAIIYIKFACDKLHFSINNFRL